MADMQSATAEIRRGKKKRKKKKKKKKTKKKKKKKEETTGQRYNGLPYSIGRPEQTLPQLGHTTGRSSYWLSNIA